MVTDVCKPSSRIGEGKVCIEASPSVTQAADLHEHEPASLADALADLAETGRTTPCQREPDLWTSDDHKERTEAANACQMCPLIDPCRTHAEANAETWHVWGGIDRTKTSRRSKAVA